MTGYLTLEVAAAKLDIDTVEATEPAQIMVEFAPRKNPEPQTLQRSFRAW